MYIQLAGFIGCLLSNCAAGDVTQHVLSQQRSPFTPKLDAVINQTLTRYPAAGLSVAVIDGDEVFAKVYHVISRRLA